MNTSETLVDVPGYFLNSKDFDSFIGKLNKKSPIIIFGSNRWGEYCYYYLKLCGFTIGYFVDNDSSKWGDFQNNVEIITTDRLKDIYVNQTVIVSPRNHWVEIRSQLVESGIPCENIYRLPILQYNTSIRLPDNALHSPSELPYIKTNSANPTATFFSLVYNTEEQYLRRAIESVIRQTYKNWKYLIYDNGISDGSRIIIDEYVALDSRITVIAAEENFYLSEKHKLDLIKKLELHMRENITTEYICILDSDDYYADTFLSDTLNAAKTNNADCVCVSTQQYYEDNLCVDYEFATCPPKFGPSAAVAKRRLYMRLVHRISIGGGNL
jgi:hypothetical protein